MKSTLKKFFIVVPALLVALVSCKLQNNKPFKIVAIEGNNIIYPLNGDTAKSLTARFDDFIVQGSFKQDANTRQRIEQFAEAYADSLRNTYQTYGMAFYKEAGEINVKDVNETEVKFRWKTFVRAKPFYEIEWREGKRLQ